MMKRKIQIPDATAKMIPEVRDSDRGSTRVGPMKKPSTNAQNAIPSINGAILDPGRTFPMATSRLIPIDDGEGRREDAAIDVEAVESGV